MADLSAKAKERIRRELEGEPTGFDALLEAKETHILKLVEIINSGGDWTYQDAAKKLGVSYRTVLRYMKVIRKRKLAKSFTTNADKQLIEKEERILSLQKLMLKHPEFTKEQLSDKMKISVKTLNGYVKKFPTIK